MGIKRGDFESIGLGALAQSVNPNYHQHASIAPGLGALAKGMVAYADGWGYIKKGLEDWSKHFWQMSDMAQKASKRQAAYKSMEATASKQLEQYCKTHDKDTWESDAQYWRLQDNIARSKGLQEGNTIFGNLFEPDVTAGLTQEQRQTRVDAYNDESSAYGVEGKRKVGKIVDKKDIFGINAWDGERD